MSDEYAYWKRKWLNRKGHHSIAFIYATVCPRAKAWMDADITLSDCGKQITLDFCAHDKSGFNNSLRKLDILIETLTEFREHYVNEWNSPPKE